MPVSLSQGSQSGQPLLVAQTTKAMTGNNTTTAVPIFNVVGCILITKLYGVVTTTLGTNHTNSYWRLNDGTVQTNITFNAPGATLSNMTAGSIIEKSDLVSVAADVDSAAAGLVEEHGAANTFYFQNFRVSQKTGGVTTNIEYRYTTTNTPTTGAIQFFIEYQPLSANASVTAL